MTGKSASPDALSFRTYVFDCDGVVLDSNRVKTYAFYQAALPYGKTAATKLVDYHVENGGISRYLKFDYFLSNIVVGENGPGRDEMLELYSEKVREGLLTCQVAPALRELRAATRDSRWMIVSGGDQAELRAVFRHRGLDDLFDAGIFGSPDTKDQILSRQLKLGTIDNPAVFLGDSKYDMEAATRAGLDFIFVRNWSEASFELPESMASVGALQDLLGGQA